MSTGLSLPVDKCSLFFRFIIGINTTLSLVVDTILINGVVWLCWLYQVGAHGLDRMCVSVFIGWVYTCIYVSISISIVLKKYSIYISLYSWPDRRNDVNSLVGAPTVIKGRQYIHTSTETNPSRYLNQTKQW